MELASPILFLLMLAPASDGSSVWTGTPSGHKGNSGKPFLSVYERGATKVARRVEFHDARGQVRKVFDMGSKGTRSDPGSRRPRIPSNLNLIIPDEVGNNVAVIIEPVPRRVGVEAVVTLYDSSGRELWSADVHCDNGIPFWKSVSVAANGSVAAILDAVDGEPCIDPDDAGGTVTPHPDWLGIRIYSSSGRLLLRESKAGLVLLSPSGKFGTFPVRTDGGAIMRCIVNLETGKRRVILEDPQAAGGVPESISDDGRIYFPKTGGRRFVLDPDKGLQQE